MHVRFVDELSLALVSSTRARAKIVSVDFSAALAAPGVVDYVDYKDLPGNNMYGLIVPEIELLPQSEVGSFCYIPNSLSPGMGGKIMKFSQICPNRNTTPNSFFEQYPGLSYKATIRDGASTETDRSEVLRHSWCGMIKISHCACSKTARAEQLYKFLNFASLPRHVLWDGTFLAIINLSFLIVFKICSGFCPNKNFIFF